MEFRNHRIFIFKKQYLLQRHTFTFILILYSTSLSFHLSIHPSIHPQPETHKFTPIPPILIQYHRVDFIFLPFHICTTFLSQQESGPSSPCLGSDPLRELPARTGRALSLFSGADTSLWATFVHRYPPHPAWAPTLHARPSSALDPLSILPHLQHLHWMDTSSPHSGFHTIH